MILVKVFRFTVNNRTCSDVADDKNMPWYLRESQEIATPEIIENILNSFMETHNVLDVDVTPITCRKNDDRARDDDVDLFYTLTYETSIEEYKKEQEMIRRSKQESTKYLNNAQQKNQTLNYNNQNNAQNVFTNSQMEMSGQHTDGFNLRPRNVQNYYGSGE